VNFSSLVSAYKAANPAKTLILENSVMWCLEALPRLEAASRQNFHCLGLGLGLDP